MAEPRAGQGAGKEWVVSSDEPSSPRVAPGEGSPSPSLEEKRQRRRAKNRAKKEESRRTREEEMRRRLYAPKNQRVRLVDRSQADAWREGGRGADRAPSPPPAPASEEHFPGLGRARPGRPRTATSGGPDAVARATEDPCPLPPAEGGEVPSPSRAPGKAPKPRRADPITVDLLSAVRRPNAGTAERRRLAPAQRRPARVAGGNQLDASRPERRRGKVRETPRPPRPTHLKAVILRDRQARKELQERPRAGGDDLACDAVPPGNGETWETRDGPAPDVAVSEPAEREHSEGTSGWGEEGEARPGELVENVLALRIDEERVAPESVHGGKFREYCDHVPSAELDAAVRALVADIVRFQDRMYHSDPVRARAKRRFVLGFREARKYLLLGKVKLLVVAPDLEAAPSRGGIEDTVSELRELCRAQDVPCAFSCRRAMLRRLTNKSCALRGVSCVAVLSYEGSQENFRAVAALLPELRGRYERLVGPAPALTLPEVSRGETMEEEEKEDVNKQVVADFLVKLSRELGDG